MDSRQLFVAIELLIKDTYWTIIQIIHFLNKDELLFAGQFALNFTQLKTEKRKNALAKWLRKFRFYDNFLFISKIRTYDISILLF